MGEHTVEKIGGTSMSRFGELMDNILIADRKGADLYNRIFVVSAYGGVTNLLLEDKKTGEPGIYGSFAAGDNRAWQENWRRPAAGCWRSTAASPDSVWIPSAPTPSSMKG